MTNTIKLPTYFYGFFNQEVGNEIEVSAEKRKEILKQFPALYLGNPQGTFDISSYEHKQKIPNTILLLIDYSKEFATNGNPFLKMNFTNGVGKVSAKMFDRNGSVDRIIELLEKYAIFEVGGDVNVFNGNKSITAQKITPFEGDVNPTELLPASMQHVEDMIVELVLYLEDLSEPFRTIALNGLKRYWTEFSLKAAAMGHHHNYLQGLLKHTLGLTRLAVYITKKGADPYKNMLKLLTVAEKSNKQELFDNLHAEVPKKARDMVWNGSFDHLYSVFEQFTRVKEEEVNSDLLICAILFHDMGKILEYSHAGENWIEKWKWMYPNADYSSFEDKKESGIAMDPVGGGTGHIPLGIMMLRDIIVDLQGVTIKIEDIGKLNHCLAAHHGKLEWGSASWMQSPESMLIHFVDYLDSRWEGHDKIK